MDTMHKTGQQRKTRVMATLWHISTDTGTLPAILQKVGSAFHLLVGVGKMSRT